MNAIRSFLLASRNCFLAAASTLALMPNAYGATIPIDLNIDQPDRLFASANSTELFRGTLTNNTGAEILASDLFFNFSGFDPGVLTLTQLLGDTDFAIPDGGTSPSTDLFKIDIGVNAGLGITYFADVFAQDADVSFSNIQTVSVRTVPAPGALGLFVSAIVAGLVPLWRRGISITST